MGVLELAKKLNKKYGDDKLAITADITPKYTRVATGAFGFDYPLQGGLPEGRQHAPAGQDAAARAAEIRRGRAADALRV